MWCVERLTQPALRSQELQRADLCFAVFSEVHLDHAASLTHLRAIFQGYVDADFVPYAIVLCGNFGAAPDVADAEQLERYASGFEALAELLQRFPRLLRETHFVFVPGPDDPAATPVLPRARLPAPIAARFERRLPGEFCAARVHWASNPCRLVYFSQEVVVFRDDLMSKMLRSAVKLKHELREGDLQKFVRVSLWLTQLVSTLLDQAHLCPLPPPVRPVAWEYANALRLYPMPSAVRAALTQLVLADRYERFELTYEGCHVFNPGSFRGGAYGWATYYPATGQAERRCVWRGRRGGRTGLTAASCRRRRRAKQRRRCFWGRPRRGARRRAGGSARGARAAAPADRGPAHRPRGTSAS